MSVAETSHRERQKLAFRHVETCTVGDRCLFQVICHNEVVQLKGGASDIDGMTCAVQDTKGLQQTKPPLTHALNRLTIWKLLAAYLEPS